MFVKGEKVFDLFETFITLYDTRSFTVTANILFITQSTVTKRIQRLENELESQFFYRKNIKEVLPTQKADEFYPIAQKFISEWHSVQENLKNRSQKTSLEIAFTQSTAKIILPHLFNILKEDLKKINIKVRLYDSEKILSLIESKDIDFGIIDKDFENSQITKVPLFDDNLVLSGSNETGILFVHETKHQLGCSSALKFLQKNSKYSFSNIIKINDYESIIDLLEKNLGAALIPQSMLPKDLVFKYLENHYSVHYCLIYHSNEINPTVLSILKTFQDNIQLIISELRNISP